MIDKNKAGRDLMRICPTYPGLLDDTEGDERIATAQYQCLKTTSAVVPDHDVVSPHECGGHRKCFQKF